jgi:hypothetical protein
MTTEQYNKIQGRLWEDYGNNFDIESTDRHGGSTVVRYRRWYHSVINKKDLITEHRIALFNDDMNRTNDIVC